MLAEVKKMQPCNAYLTDQFQEYVRMRDYVFQEKYLAGNEEKELLNYKLLISRAFYQDVNSQVSQYKIRATLTRIMDDQKYILAENRSFDSDFDVDQIVKHSNGCNYLITSADLNGYCVINLSTRSIYRYLPLECFIGKSEPFIWCKVLYCKTNNLLAVDGCYWGSTFSIEVYDFSNPEIVPYPRVFNSFDLEGQVSIYDDITPLCWNDDGTLRLSCYIDERGNIKTEKAFDFKTNKFIEIKEK